MEELEQPRQTFRRSPFEILGECFSIYGRHFRQFILIALIIQAPLVGIALVLGDSLPSEEDLQRLQVSIIGDARASLPESAEYSTESSELPEPLTRSEIVGLAIPTIGYFIATLILQTFVVGAVIAAVGMQYATGGIDVVRCYSRAWWRVLTLVILGLALFGLVILMIAGFALLIVPGIVILALTIYWSVDVPSAVIEGRKPIAALKRSFELVRNNWWRTFATWALIILVVIGMSLVIGFPLGALSAIATPDGIIRSVVETLVNTIVGAIITPITGIAAALIYLDLRSEKEDYDIEALSEQMGIAPRDES